VERAKVERGKALIYACILLVGFATGVAVARQVYLEELRPEPCVHPGRFVPLPPLNREAGVTLATVLPEVDVIDIEGVRRLAGRRARVRGKVYRVGHSPKSDTYFLDFGPSRASFTAVIFASAADAFKRARVQPRQYEGKEVELVGRIEDDPRYGLEMVVEEPAQITQLD